MPNYGIAAWCIDQADADRDAFDVAARYGLGAVHLAVGSTGDVASLKHSAWRIGVGRRCIETGTHISCLALNIVEQMAICGAYRDDSSRRQFWDVCLAALEFAAEVAVPLIYVPSFGLAEIMSDADLCETAELIGRVAEAARPLRIDVASENSLGAANCTRLIDLVDSDNFKILFDIYNPLRWGHSPKEIIAAEFDSFAAQIHVKDGWLPGYGNAPLGEGDGSVLEIVQELLRRGFDGTFVLENDYGKWRGLDVQMDLKTLKAFSGR
ncbi:sugar phosphate isomerase/epimerase family protein [Burkholderia oklahomensis]|uniref:Xylose isomerase-like TIM barrel family protein n=1 Tax=Burkholderia oklahomensis TaxID=342113 RepID=A0AAI8FQK8_9BURK|nr:TIM barrel protein [Burkholderia oklahomensis]AIO69090.1 xylose isomerase-like TIM barrel family protein [Burkholderia oklahomensis]AOI38999.1 hypothetical protein WG70_04785 [Burkholderia oklahomensis EO147]KUY52137.1 hypothetical protein WG70_14790 [Burkholderia oklahomensis EO147]QPS40654.1 TIM barrel protein [Burkholderia oklahomensis]